LKGQSKQSGAKLTTDFGACRDLQGRRLRHVNDEIKIRKWREAQEKQKNGGEVSDDYLFHTQSGIYNWHLMTPTWAHLSNKATNKMKRNLKRHMNEVESSQQQRLAEKKKKEDLHQQAVEEYARQTSQATEALHMAGAIRQGLSTKRKIEEVKSKLQHEEHDQEPKITDDGSEPSSFVTLSGEIIVEESACDGFKLQSLSDFATMAIVFERQPATDAVLYYEVMLESAGMAQIGWAELSAFRPSTETGDGVGDDKASYAVDFSRNLKFHGGKEEPFFVSSCAEFTGSIAKPGDIVGCSFSTKEKTLCYSLNGEDMGIAFVLDKMSPLVPALSCNQGEILDLRIRQKQMKYRPNGATVIFQLTAMEDEIVPTKPAEAIGDESKERLKPDERKATLMEQDSDPLPKKPKIKEEALDLEQFHSVDELAKLGLDRLKSALRAIQCKCGGSLEERAMRLFSLKGLERKDYPAKVRARNFVI
jgi:hypothetical protein